MKFKKMIYRTSQMAGRAALSTVKIPEPPVLKGPGMVSRFPEIIATTEVSNLLIITGPHLAESGLLTPFINGLDALGINHVLFTDRQNNPTTANVADALVAYYHNGCDGIVGFGGGSSLDCAKITAAKVTNDQPIPKMRGAMHLHHRLPPFFAIPTTAGSGSEATPVAVITDDSTFDKFLITDTKLVPLATVLDAELTQGLSAKLTAECGMDALTHAIEAFIGHYDSPYVKEKATAAIRTIVDNLEATVADGTDIDRRQALLEASFDAGLAFTHGLVGNVHALAHAIGGRYDLPHGRLCAIILPKVLEFSKPDCLYKLAELAFATGQGDATLSDAELADAFIAKIEAMNTTMGIPSTIPELLSEDVPQLVHTALAEANPSYPVPRILDYNSGVELMGALLEDDHAE